MTVNIQLRNLDSIRKRDTLLAEALDDLVKAISTVALQTGSVAQGNAPTPAAPSSLNVTAAGGIFDIAITDNNPQHSGIAPDYFLEYSLTASFAQPVVIHLGPARNFRANLGNQTLYWRAYSQIGRASQPSPKVYFGNSVTPTPVVGGGAIAGPNPLASTGSGTGPTTGLQGGSGYGALSVRAPKPLNTL